ncbi:hypothetical protein HU200_056248 [Digitaria exilis]|uniref:Uncharacterized protein n=1 Tax=Digitaria exilis TaxID=1010633 RepID=A0A835AS60_9POAL|nr:hypothetical protein HU200_056248 [Digitaria exilis]
MRAALEGGIQHTLVARLTPQARADLDLILAATELSPSTSSSGQLAAPQMRWISGRRVSSSSGGSSKWTASSVRRSYTGEVCSLDDETAKHIRLECPFSHHDILDSHRRRPPGRCDNGQAARYRAP